MPMNYLIGDLQGCCDAFDRLLAEIGFSPSRDRIYVLGDLVNRGPASLQTLRRLRQIDDAATCLLGNHDLHLLAVAHGIRKPHKSDTVAQILEAPDAAAWIDWLRHRRMVVHELGWLMVHAGVPPQWTLATTLSVGAEIEAHLRGPNLHGFLQTMYGNAPTKWRDDLQGPERWRFAINALTRMRFCKLDGSLDLETKEAAHAAPAGSVPWFDFPGRLTADTPIAFGHWSTLGLVNRPDLLAIDTGCVWGGQLTAVRVDGRDREVIQVPCEQALVPGQDG